MWCATPSCAPHHVNLDQIVIRPVAQASNYKLIRKQA